MKTILSLVFAAFATSALASSPALILDAGSNPKYFGIPKGNSAASSSPALIVDAGSNPKYFAKNPTVNEAASSSPALIK